MNAPYRDDATNTEQIVVDWQKIGSPQNGNSNVTSYSLEFDSGTDGKVWTALTGYIAAFTNLTTVVTENIERGATYQFKLRAQNIWGWGAYSTIHHIQAATRPLMITQITTTVNPLNGNLVIAWPEADDQGEVITSSQVQVWSKMSSKWIDQSPLTVETDYEIPMLDLQQAPYGYAQGDPV